MLQDWAPRSIYSWSTGHILEHEFFCLGRLGSSGSKEKKVDLSFSEQLLRVFFSILIFTMLIFFSAISNRHDLMTNGREVDDFE